MDGNVVKDNSELREAGRSCNRRRSAQGRKRRKLAALL